MQCVWLSCGEETNLSTSKAILISGIGIVKDRWKIIPHPSTEGDLLQVCQGLCGKIVLEISHGRFETLKTLIEDVQRLEALICREHLPLWRLATSGSRNEIVLAVKRAKALEYLLDVWPESLRTSDLPPRLRRGHLERLMAILDRDEKSLA